MTQTRITRSATGAAHLGFAMFGARCPLLSPEGEGGAGGAAPAGEGGAGSAPTNGDGTAPRSFSQAEVDQIVKDRLAKVQRAPQAAAKPAANEDAGEKLSLAELARRLNESESRRNFDRKTSKLGLADEVADDLFTLSQAQKPDNIDEWLAKKSKHFVSGATNGSAAAGATTTTAPPKPEETAAKPAAAPKAPGSHDTFVDPGGQVDIYNMSLEQVKALGPQKVRELHERNVQIGNQSSGAPPIPRIGVQKR